MRKLGRLFFKPSRLDRLARFRGDTGGVAAIEFAMVVPLMIMMFVGTVEFSQVITVDRRVSQVASATADLVARTKSLSATEMTGVLQVVGELIKPYDATLLKLTVMNVKASPTDATDTKVCWHRTHNGGVSTPANNSAYTLPTGVVEQGDSVIVTEVEYNYSPLIFNYFITGPKKLEEKFYLKPRLSSFVTYDGTGCT